MKSQSLLNAGTRSCPINLSELVSGLDRIWGGNHRGGKPKTKAIFGKLKTIGQQLKCRPVKKIGSNQLVLHSNQIHSYFRGSGKRYGEFRLDFLWWQQGSGPLMACESEFGGGKIEDLSHDFEKLESSTKANDCPRKKETARARNRFRVGRIR